MKKTSPINWLYISLAGFILFLLFFYFLVLDSKQVNISMPLYFILVILIALVATAFLAGAMKSTARFKSTAQNRSLYLSGPAVIFFIILYIGYKYRPTLSQEPLSLSVLVSTGANELLKEGSVSVRVAQFSSTKKIDHEGTALFTGINPNYKGHKVEIGLDVPGYYLAGGKTFTLSESENYTNLTISLNKTKDITRLHGRVISLPERTGIAGATIYFQGADTVIKTDETGSFTAKLPLKSGSEIRIIATKGNKEIYNSLRTISDNDFLSIAAN
jgi:hypothetical protein